MTGPAARARSMIESVRRWAELRDDILGLALVGSHARGEARPDSDIDFLVLCADPARYLAHPEWVSAFGEVASLAFEDWGKVQSIRVHYQDGPEVEFGIAGTDWIAVPPDEGTAEVLRAGCIVLFDRDGLIERLRHGACGG